MANYSTAWGNYSVATGMFSTAWGEETDASGESATAPSAYETALGAYNTTYTPASIFNWNSSDRLFVVGRGTSNDSWLDAMVIMKEQSRQMRMLEDRLEQLERMLE